MDLELALNQSGCSYLFKHTEAGPRWKSLVLAVLGRAHARTRRRLVRWGPVQLLTHTVLVALLSQTPVSIGEPKMRRMNRFRAHRRRLMHPKFQTMISDLTRKPLSDVNRPRRCCAIRYDAGGSGYKRQRECVVPECLADSERAGDFDSRGLPTWLREWT